MRKRRLRAMLLGGVVMVLTAAEPCAAIDHGLSPIYHWTHIRTDEHQSYHFHSPGVSYGVITGERIGFLGRLSLIFPRGLYQDGARYPFSDFYDSGFGADVTLGAGYQHPFTAEDKLIVGLGFHTNGFKLSSNRYESFYTFSGGVGVETRLSFRVHEWICLGGFVNAAVDFADFIHTDNTLTRGVFVTAGLTIELNFEPEEAI